MRFIFLCTSEVFIISLLQTHYPEISAECELASDSQYMGVGLGVCAVRNMSKFRLAALHSGISA